MGQQDLAGFHGYLAFAQRLGNDHAQRHMPVGQAVAVKLGAVVGQLAHAATHRIAKQPVEPAATRLE